MKNKKSLYFLIPLTIVIWGLLLWKIFAYTSSVDSYNYPYENQPERDSFDSISYILIAKYPDPFLRNLVQTTAANTEQSSVKGISEFHTKSLKSLINVPEINYKGCIENENRKIALITYKNTKYLLTKGDSIEQFIIQYIYPDSLKISYLDKTYSYVQK